MHLNDETEILIERCVDDELNADDTRALMMEMDGVEDGWKTLACRFLEERMLQQHVRDVVSGCEASQVSEPGRNVGGTLTGSDSAAAVRGSRNWFGHPVVSLSLCAAIAFVSGLLIPKSEFGGRTVNSQSAVVQGNTAVGSGDQTGTGNVAGDEIPRRAVPQYTLEWTPDSGRRQTPLQIPVFQDLDDYAHELAGNRQLFSADGRGFFSESEADQATRVLRIPLNDSEDILLFVQEQEFGLPLQ